MQCGLGNIIFYSVIVCILFIHFDLHSKLVKSYLFFKKNVAINSVRHRNFFPDYNLSD